MTDFQRIQKGMLLTKVSLRRETVYLVFSPVGTDLFFPSFNDFYGLAYTA